jgi:hypothetical protein
MAADVEVFVAKIFNNFSSSANCNCEVGICISRQW